VSGCRICFRLSTISTSSASPFCLRSSLFADPSNSCLVAGRISNNPDFVATCNLCFRPLVEETISTDKSPRYAKQRDIFRPLRCHLGFRTANSLAVGRRTFNQTSIPRDRQQLEISVLVMLSKVMRWPSLISRSIWVCLAGAKFGEVCKPVAEVNRGVMKITNTKRTITDGCIGRPPLSSVN